MGLINPDFSEEVLPPKPGEYRARIAKVEQKFGKTYGTPFLNWKLECATPRGILSVFHSTPIAGKGAGFFRRFMEAIDPNYDGRPVDADQLIGRTLRVQLEDQVDANNRKTGYLKVAEVMPDPDHSEFSDPSLDFPNDVP